MAESQEPYPYNKEGLDALTLSLSPPRLLRYLNHAQRNQEHSLAFYLWNARLSKALRFPLEVAEVIVRNRAHYALCDRWGPDWPRAPGFRATAAPKTIDKIEEVYAHLGPNVPADKIVAALSFGFWPALFKGRFPAALWEQRIDRFFPNMPTGLPAEKVDRIREILELALILRNRIGHLEPIFTRSLSLEHSSLVKLVSYACRKSAGWMKAHSTINAVLRDGPNAFIAEPFFLRRAIRDASEIDENASLKEASLLLAQSSAPIILVKGTNPTLLSRVDIGDWLLSKAVDGIVDLDDATVSQVIQSGPRAPVISRKATFTDLRSALSKSASRFAIVTETGASDQKVLGVVDLMKLLS